MCLRAQDSRTLTFGALLLPLHLPAVLLQLSVGERVEGVGARGAHDDVGLVLLLNDGLGGCHQLPLQTKRDAQSVGALPAGTLPPPRAKLQAGRGGQISQSTQTTLRLCLGLALGPETEAKLQPPVVGDRETQL